MIFIGTKLDLAGEKRVNGIDKGGGDIAQDWGADKLYLVRKVSSLHITFIIELQYQGKFICFYY